MPELVDPPDPAVVLEILKQRAQTDPGLALVIEAAEWKALYLATREETED